MKIEEECYLFHRQDLGKTMPSARAFDVKRGIGGTEALGQKKAVIATDGCDLASKTGRRKPRGLKLSQEGRDQRPRNVLRSVAPVKPYE